MNTSSKVYALSLKFSPPKINLRQANILDDYGDESYSKLPISHKRPDEVRRTEFDYYPHVYPFMEKEDLLFYFYPIIVEYKKDKQRFESIDSFMYSFDRYIEEIKDSLEKKDLEAVREGLLELWNIGEDDFADWAQCLSLQKFIGLIPKLQSES